MTYTLGIDPSSKPEKTECIAVDESGALVDIAGVQWSGQYPDAVIIEWAEATAGAYTGVRSRVADLMRLAVEQERIKALYRPVCLVYCVPRRVILAQAGYSPRRDGPADKWVSLYLIRAGYAKVKQRHTIQDPNMVDWYTWRGTLLNTPDKRDALMAALWNYKDVRNKEYRANE